MKEIMKKVNPIRSSMIKVNIDGFSRPGIGCLSLKIYPKTVYIRTRIDMPRLKKIVVRSKILVVL
jgi:hypothetical protein